MATATRLAIFAALGWVVFLAYAALHNSTEVYVANSEGLPIPRLTDFMSSWRWPIGLLPLAWPLLLVGSLLLRQPKDWIDHYLFIASFIAVSMAIAATFAFAAALPWI